jgi:signal transduction histidine kinase
MWAMKRHTILVVDDEPDVVKSVQDLLRLDYNVLGATRATDGMQLMAEHAIDVVMTDQRMPEMTGVQFLKRIKGPHPEATRLLFTGYADIRAVIEAINQGNVYRYITKPWDPDELLTIIREACERHDLIVQRRELMDQLERKNQELEQANQELREANEVKAMFIQVASHELRTPLSILGGYTELATRAAEAGEPLGDSLARMSRATSRLQHLIDQIISMLDAGEFDTRLHRRPSDLPAVLSGAVEDVQPFITLRKQALVRDWPADLGTINIDDAKIRDCLNQLLLNAIKFTADGGRISVSARRDDHHVAITVTDTGCGIDQTCLRHFGEAFFTGYDVTHHASGTYEHGRRGLGLGVSVVKKFVEMHDGTVEVSSEVGRGTSVTMKLPEGSSPSPAGSGVGKRPRATARQDP